MKLSIVQMADVLTAIAGGMTPGELAPSHCLSRWELMHEVMLAEFFGLRAWAIFGEAPAWA